MICVKIFIALVVAFMLVEQGDGQNLNKSETKKVRKGIFKVANLDNLEKLLKLIALPERLLEKGILCGAKGLRNLLFRRRKNAAQQQLLQQGYGQHVDNSGKKQGSHLKIIRLVKKICPSRQKKTEPPKLVYLIPPGGPNYVQTPTGIAYPMPHQH